jgi:hypothetical protein
MPSPRPWPPVTGPIPRPVRKVGAPLGVLIAFGALTGLLVLMFTVINPLGAIVGFVLSTVTMTLVVFAYLWLDRWEPEPPRLLLMAFGWGASIAVVPIFALMIGVAVASRRREQRLVAAKLPGMVAAGLITDDEATWLGSLRTRRGAINEATRVAGRPAGKAVAGFAAAVVELAFVRDRIDRGFGDQRVYALLKEEVYAVTSARSAAPILAWLAAYRAVR